MNDDGANLIQQLCTRAGMEMEDAIPMALKIKSHRADGLAETLSELRKKADRISALVRAMRNFRMEGRRPSPELFVLPMLAVFVSSRLKAQPPSLLDPQVRKSRPLHQH